MPPPTLPALLDETLRAVSRRYRLPAIAAVPGPPHAAQPATALAAAIERAREALDRNEVPGAALKRVFIEALARLIHDAIRPGSGDPAFQAMVLRHRHAHLREYASLAAHTARDRRAVYATVNAIAHPARQQRSAPGPQRDALARLHAAASAASWETVYDIAKRLLAMPKGADASSIQRGLSRLLDGPELDRLRRLEELAADALVRQYQTLVNRNGPRPGSSTAAAQGAAAQQRGAAVEALATQALETLAQRLNQAERDPQAYRVVSSMRVPASIPANPDRAKSEWDVVLLRRVKGHHSPDGGHAPVWGICLLVEAKASVDAATTDLARLLRGLRLLAHADGNTVYPFETRQGVVALHGASLHALATDESSLARSVLYCCDAPAEAAPRLLGAASRMQLLSAPASVKFASALAEKKHADPQDLEPVWRDLLESPRWRAVLWQYPTLRQARELMVHTDDLLAAIRGTHRGRKTVDR